MKQALLHVALVVRDRDGAIASVCGKPHFRRSGSSSLQNIFEPFDPKGMAHASRTQPHELPKLCYSEATAGPRCATI